MFIMGKVMSELVKNVFIVISVAIISIVFYTIGFNTGALKEKGNPSVLNMEQVAFSVESCFMNGGLEKIIVSKQDLSAATCKNGAFFKLPDQKNIKNGTEKEI